MRTTKANGWGVFGATLLFVVGAINVVQGIVAMFTPEYYFVADGDMLVTGFTLWGIVLAVWGVVLLAAGAALLSGKTWARALAVVLAAVNAVAQLAFLVSNPLWSLIAIAIDVLVIYGMTAGWPDHLARDDDAYGAGRADARGVPADTGRRGTAPAAGAAGEEAVGPAGRASAAHAPEGTGRGRHEHPTG
jgi:hypothetical protein